MKTVTDIRGRQSLKTVAQSVVETLKEIGVRHVFGVPSGAWIDYMEAIRRTDGIEFVLTSHETGAGFMAAVCGGFSGVPGVCFGTFGPGATNLAGGVGCAFLDRMPVIALTDEVPDNIRNRTVQMNIDHQALFAPITKRTLRLNPDRARDDVLYAAELALSARPGPVHIGLPTGTASLPVLRENRTEVAATPLPQAEVALMEQMERLFMAAKKPLLVVGPGAVRAGVRGLLQRIAEKFRLPVVLTPMAKGMFRENHPCYCGVLLHALSDQVALTYGQADLVISVGYDPVEFNYEEWMPHVPLISIDVVAADIDRNQYPSVCDVSGAISPVLERMLSIDANDKCWDMEALAKRRNTMFKMMSPASETFGPCRALDILRDELPPDGILTSDVGAHLHLIGQKWNTPAPGKLLMTNGWSSMGFSIPAAIAAKICNPELPVCAAVGDGGFLMSVGELATAVRENLRIVFVLFSDGDLSLIRIKQDKKGYPGYGTSVCGRGALCGDSIFGVPVIKVDSCTAFRSALQYAFRADGPVVVEALLDSREYDSLLLRENRAHPAVNGG